MGTGSVVDWEAKIPQRNHDKKRSMESLPRKGDLRSNSYIVYANNQNSGGVEVYACLVPSKKLPSDSQYFAKCRIFTLT